MSIIWELKLKLTEKFREEIEEYLISLNATVTSIDAENNTHILEPKIYNTSAFFIKKPIKNEIKLILENYKINANKITLSLFINEK